MKTKGLGILAIIIIVGNFLLFVFEMIEITIFWGILIAGALFAYKILPNLNKKI